MPFYRARYAANVRAHDSGGADTRPGLGSGTGARAYRPLVISYSPDAGHLNRTMPGLRVAPVRGAVISPVPTFSRMVIW